MYRVHTFNLKYIPENIHLIPVCTVYVSDWNVKDINAKYSSNPAKFRDLIGEIKQRADLD
jgi:hypothetical protein